MRVFSALSQRLRWALKEDEAKSDITTLQIPGSKTKQLSAKIVSKKEGVFCGSFLLAPLFRLLDPKIKIKAHVGDGKSVRKGQAVATLKGRANAILAGERIYLNLAGRLSGIATLTRDYVRAVRKTGIEILDTRKTTPHWRDLEKFAVVCGGGKNHRFSLKDALLIKDTHLKFIRDRGQNVTDVYPVGKTGQLKKRGVKFIEMEARTYEDVWDGIKMQADVIMLDNMTPQKIKGSMTFVRAAREGLGSQKPLVEISGGITMKNIRTFAKLGVDRISIGALTHSAPSLDLSLEVI